MPRTYHILCDFSPQSAYWRGVIRGVARFSADHPEVQLRQLASAWELIGNPDAVDGVIAVVRDEPSHVQARRFGKPVVNISAISDQIYEPTVTMDNAAAGALAADHLLSQGYNSFAYHMESRVYYSRMRCKGFVDRLAQANKTCAIFDTATNEQFPVDDSAQLRRRTIEWLKGLPKPVGLLTHNDVRAAALIDVCHEIGLRVPEDVGVVGIDNDEFVADIVQPPLTSVDLAPDVVGYQAAELLISLIEGGTHSLTARLILPRRVVARASTQPVSMEDESLSRAIAFIRDNATKFITVNDVIANAMTSRRSLERRFREHLGRTPADEIRRVQMDHARRVLIDTNKTLAWVARATGYTCSRNFATAFRREVGVSPTTYRTQYRTR